MVGFFQQTNGAGRVVAEIVTAGITPAANEIMDALAIHASEQMAHAGYPLDAGACLLIDLDGPQEECRTRLDEVFELCERHGGRALRGGKEQAGRHPLWKTRKAALP